LINIVADQHIPGLGRILEDSLGTEYALQYFSPEDWGYKDLKDIDVLFVRSTVNVNQDLCRDSKIRFVGSATAGINHLDIKFLKDHNIEWVYAPGCNSISVVHYVMAAIGELIAESHFNVDQSIGIIGYGNIGKKLYKLLSALKIPVYAYDPFLSDDHLIELDQVLECDLISIHAPLTHIGEHGTQNLINHSHTKALKNKILINTSRGGIVSEDLVIESKDLIYIADVWIDEPNPSKEIIDRAFIATPHIAGYSIEGKLNGATTVARACAQFFNCQKEDVLFGDGLFAWPHGMGQIIHDLQSFRFPIAIFKSELDIKGISNIFKSISPTDISYQFTNLRLNHAPRHDCNYYSYEGILKMDQSIDVNFFNALKDIS